MLSISCPDKRSKASGKPVRQHPVMKQMSFGPIVLLPLVFLLVLWDWIQAVCQRAWQMLCCRDASSHYSLPLFVWSQCQGLNPGTCACQASMLPLSYSPSPYSKSTRSVLQTSWRRRTETRGLEKEKQLTLLYSSGKEETWKNKCHGLGKVSFKKSIKEF